MKFSWSGAVRHIVFSVLSVLGGALLGTTLVAAATTISTNITTAGTLDVEGASTLASTTATTFKVGQTGTSNTLLLKGTCALIDSGESVVASTSVPFDCAVTGSLAYASGDTVYMQFATTSRGSAATNWTIVGAKASSTAGYITAMVRNNTGGDAVVSATGIASTTNYIIIR